MIDENTVFIAFDTETTGLTATDGFIVEIAAIKFDFNGNEIDRFSELVHPPIAMPEVAERIHRISDAMIANKPFIDIVLPKFIDFFSGEQNVLIAQNAIFDIGFMNHEALRCDIKLPRNAIIDQIDLTRTAYPGLPSYALEKVCKQFRLTNTQTHRAMADAELVRKLFIFCLNRWPTVDNRLSVLNSLYRYTFGGPMIARIDQGLVDSINSAMEAGESLEIIYSGGSLRGHPRPIRPLMLFNRDGVTYLSARCLLSNTNKQFRLDRMEECRPLKNS